ncbi:MAG: glycosyltransferase family 2 protein [Verrucomicrobiota bacterium]
MPDSAAATPPARRKKISIVTPCYNEQDNVRECWTTVRELFEKELPDYDLEHIICDNCSKDETVARLREMSREDSRLKIILNARNFGPFCNTFNGILATTGDAVVAMLPVDLQDPPEVIPTFVRHWENGYEVVYGTRANRAESWVMRTVRHLYYRLVSRFAEFDVPNDVGEFQLIDRAVVDALRRFEDYYPYIRGMIASCGFRSIGVSYTWRARKRGFSKNRLYHLVDQGLNGLISFTKIPLRLTLVFGFGLAFCSILFGLASLVANLILWRQAPRGIPTLIVSLFFFSGVQLFFIGILGEYICAIHSQVRKRPLVIERERLNFN